MQYLGISDTCFTHMNIVGRMNQSGGHIPVHSVKPDVISDLFHIENVTSGEATNYYDGSTIKKLVISFTQCHFNMVN